MPRSPLSGDGHPGVMKWRTPLLLLLVLPQSLPLLLTPPGDPVRAGAVAVTTAAPTELSSTGDPPSAVDTTAQSNTAPPAGFAGASQRSPADLFTPAPPDSTTDTAAGVRGDSNPAATDMENTAVSRTRTKLQSDPSDHDQPVLIYQSGDSGRDDISGPKSSLSTTQIYTPNSDAYSQQEILKSSGTSKSVVTSVPNDGEPTTKIKRHISSTSVTPAFQTPTQGTHNQTEEISTTVTASHSNQNTLPPQFAEARLSPTTTRLSDIRDNPTTKVPVTEMSHTGGAPQPGTGGSIGSSESDPGPPTSPSSVRAAPPPPPRSPSPSTDPNTVTSVPDLPESPNLQSGSAQSSSPPVHHLSPAPDPLDPLPASASSSSPVPSSSPSEEATLPDASPATDMSAEGVSTEPKPKAEPEPEQGREPKPEPEPEPELGPEPEPVTAPQFNTPGVACAPELPPDVKTWSPGRDIKINFPLTIPGECTPAEQCSVSTVIDQRVTVQTSDTVTVRFEVSATGGVAPAAASLALRRADHGTTDCPIDHGAAPPALLVSANQRRRLGGHLLRPGVNHFFGRISLASEECFRLVVTVRSADCGDPQMPCGGRGYCVARSDQETFNCTCCSESSGPYCGVSDPCTVQPCPEGSTCTTNGSSFTCSCPKDLTGPNCTLSVDTCDTCLNGGTCVAAEADSGAGARCRCPAGFVGDRCQRPRQEGAQEASPCRSSPCLRGDCQMEGDTAICLCPPGYRGQLCETQDVCSPAPCQYGGTCIALEDNTRFNCSCAAGYRGSVCQFRVLPLCTVHPCSNGGTCWDEGTSYYCTCQHGFSGKHCEVPPGLIGHFDIHHIRSGVPVMAALSAGLFIVIAVVGCCYCRSVGLRQALGRLCRPVSRCRSAARCCPRRTYKQFSEDQRKNLLEMGYSHTHQPIVEPIFADVDYSEAAEMPLIT